MDGEVDGENLWGEAGVVHKCEKIDILNDGEVNTVRLTSIHHLQIEGKYHVTPGRLTNLFVICCLR